MSDRCRDWSLLPSYKTPMLCQDPPPNLQRGLTCTEDPCDSHPSVDVNWLQNEGKGGTATITTAQEWQNSAKEI